MASGRMLPAPRTALAGGRIAVPSEATS